MTTKKIFFGSVILFSALLFVVPTGYIDSDYGNTILTVSTFLFGIFGGFCVAVTTTDYNTVRGLAARETASWISLYQAVRVYGKKFADEIKPLISRYIIRSFDYDFIDYARETKKDFKAVAEYVVAIPVIESQSSGHENIMDELKDLVATRQELTALGKRSLSSLEWIVLITLAGIVVMTLYGLRADSWFFNFVTVAISSMSVLVLVLIHDIDRYVWNEASFSFDVFNNVLLSLDELPYYPAEFIHDGTVVPREKTYQIGTLVSPGKNWDRTITVHGAQEL